MSFRKVSVAGLILCLGFLSSCTQAPSSRVDFQGWGDCYRLSNAKAQAIIVPAVGRMMSYRLTDGQNVLNVNPAKAGLVPPRPQDGYIYFGGVYTWFAPQSRWLAYDGKGVFTGGDPVLDNGPYRVTVARPDELTMVSPVSRCFGLQMIKTFKLIPNSSRLDFTVTLRNTASVPIRWAVWNLNGVKPVGVAFFAVPGGKDDLQFPVNGKKDPKKFAKVVEVLEGRIAAIDLRKYHSTGGKIFVRVGGDYLAYRQPGSWFVRRFTADTKDIFTDWQSQIEIWADAKVGHIFELEAASPDFVIPPGKSVSWTERMYIIEDKETLSTSGKEACKLKAILKKAPGIPIPKPKKEKTGKTGKTKSPLKPGAKEKIKTSHPAVNLNEPSSEEIESPPAKQEHPPHAPPVTKNK
jgi:hypothetical protein